jgi:hypothetical protein
MKPMFDTLVLPKLSERAGGVRVARRVLRVAGLGESAVDERIAPVYTQYKNPQTTILFTNTDIEIHLTAQGKTEQEAELLLDGLSGQLEERLGDSVFAFRGETMEEVVGLRLAVERLHGRRRRELHGRPHRAQADGSPRLVVLLHGGRRHLLERGEDAPARRAPGVDRAARRGERRGRRGDGRGREAARGRTSASRSRASRAPAAAPRRSPSASSTSHSRRRRAHRAPRDSCSPATATSYATGAPRSRARPTAQASDLKSFPAAESSTRT